MSNTRINKKRKKEGGVIMVEEKKKKGKMCKIKEIENEKKRNFKNK